MPKTKEEEEDAEVVRAEDVRAAVEGDPDNFDLFSDSALAAALARGD